MMVYRGWQGRLRFARKPFCIIGEYEAALVTIVFHNTALRKSKRYEANPFKPLDIKALKSSRSFGDGSRLDQTSAPFYTTPY